MSPTIKDITALGQNEFGQNKYDGILNILAMDTPNYFEIIGQKGIYEQLSSEEKSQITMFDLWTINQKNIESIQNSFSLFFLEKLMYSPTEKSFALYDKNTNALSGHIHRGNFYDLCQMILQLNYIEEKGFKNAKLKNKRAEQIAKKLKSATVQKSEQSNQDMSFANMLSALCVQHNSYNMTNVWSLTVYQLYDQFFRQNRKNQIDISSMRWSAYGTDDFDYSLWFQSIQK